MAGLFIQEGPNTGARFRLGERVTIGRSPSCAITLSDERVSRLHAEIRHVEGRYRLFDRSKNGLRVNRKMVKEHDLEAGDLIALGDTRLVFEALPSEAALDSLGEATDFPREEWGDDAPTEVIDSVDARDFSLSDSSSLSFTQLAVAETTNARLLELFDAAAALHAAASLDELTARIVEKAAHLVGAQRVSLLCWDEGAQALILAKSRRLDAAGPPFTLSRAILGRVFSEAKAILSTCRDARGDARSVIGVPLLAGEQALGVLYCDRAQPPFREEDLVALTAVGAQAALAMTHHLRLEKAIDHNRALRRRLLGEATLIGDSPSMRELAEQVDRVAATDATVLLRGETGTGKELFARAVHERSRRQGGPFIAFNCAAVTETLIESELFGHEKGAFTGAQRERAGRFEQADGGTLFLDEIGDVSPTMQTKLLRVLEQRRFDRVGGGASVQVDVRIVAATNVDLEAAVEEGRFRADLFYRLNVIVLFVPPLRERGEDILMLVEHFLERYAREVGRAVLALSDEARTLLGAYDWPGNVRELRNLCERLTVLCAADTIVAQHLPKVMRAIPDSPAALEEAPLSFPERMRRQERLCILDAARQTGGVKAEAARLLGWSRPTLDKKLAEHGLSWPGRGEAQTR